MVFVIRKRMLVRSFRTGTRIRRTTRFPESLDLAVRSERRVSSGQRISLRESGRILAHDRNARIQDVDPGQAQLLPGERRLSRFGRVSETSQINHLEAEAATASERSRRGKSNFEIEMVIGNDLCLISPGSLGIRSVSPVQGECMITF